MIRIIFVFAFCLLSSTYAVAEPSQVPSDLYGMTVNSIEGKPVPLARFKGKVLLIVNTASKCGYTPQYQDLELLHNRFKEQGFEVLGFPSNDFDSQEPGTNEEIKQFCKRNYGVSFPLFQKGAVIGEKKQELFTFLTEKNPPELNGEIGWNFEKFLIGRDGTLRSRFGSHVNPMGTAITDAVEKLLKE